jgi:hypothetical protein
MNGTQRRPTSAARNRIAVCRAARLNALRKKKQERSLPDGADREEANAGRGKPLPLQGSGLRGMAEAGP